MTLPPCTATSEPLSLPHITPSHLVRESLLLQLLKRHARNIPSDDRLRRLPNLHHVVLGRTAHQPRVVLIETEIRNPVRVPAVHEQKLARPVLLVLWRLLLAAFVQVPEQQSPI